MEKVVVLDNIRSAHNVGSIFRTADAAGVRKIYLTGYTPAPIDRFGRVQAEIKKTSLGAADSVSWEAVEDITRVLLELREEGYEIVAIEQDPRSIPYTAWAGSQRTAFIFGNEVDGVSEAARASSDAILHLPMQGEKESLNVSVAAGIVLFHCG